MATIVPALTKSDWEHRLSILQSWKYWHKNPIDPGRIDPNLDYRITYNAVIDGCAITVRALCLCFGLHLKAVDGQGGLISMPKTDQTIPGSSDARHQVLLDFCKKSIKPDNPVATAFLTGPKELQQRCLLEVLFLANRCVAHPNDGDLYHEVSPEKMKSAINTVLSWLRSSAFPGLAEVPQSLLAPLP
jgi:hypothetical protein